MSIKQNTHGHQTSKVYLDWMLTFFTFRDASIGPHWFRSLS